MIDSQVFSVVLIIDYIFSKPIKFDETENVDHPCIKPMQDVFALVELINSDRLNEFVPIYSPIQGVPLLLILSERREGQIKKMDQIEYIFFTNTHTFEK